MVPSKIDHTRLKASLTSRCMSSLLNLLGWDHAQVGTKALDFDCEFTALVASQRFTARSDYYSRARAIASAYWQSSAAIRGELSAIFGAWELYIQGAGILAEKAGTSLTFDESGKIKVTKKQELSDCNLSGDLRLRSAMQRRALAYHLAFKLTIRSIFYTEPLLTSQFWVRPVYEELLHAASRFNLSPAAEFKRLSPKSETSGKRQYASSPCSHDRVDWGWMRSCAPRAATQWRQISAGPFAVVWCPISCFRQHQVSTRKGWCPAEPCFTLPHGQNGSRWRYRYFHRQTQGWLDRLSHRRYPGAIYHLEGRDPSRCISSEGSGCLVWV